MTKTLTQAFLETVSRHGAREALRHKQGGQWRAMSYQEFGDRAKGLACGLVELGVAFGDRVALLSENRPEWVIADQGILMTGGATVPIYPTLTGKQSQYIINDCGAKVVIVSNEAQLRKLLEERAGMPAVTHFVVMDDFQQPADFNQVFRFDDVLKLGGQCAEKHSEELANRKAAVNADSLASIVYTSGTTGEPKGAMLTHGNFMSNASEVLPIIDIKETDSALSFLPLSHVLERIATYAIVMAGARVDYAESIEKLGENMQEVHPTFLVSVPRVFEKIRTRVLDKVANDPPVRQKIFHWALEVGKEMLDARQGGQPIHFGLALKHTLADRLVFSKIRERTGGELRFAISGGAPLAKDLGEFFEIVGVRIIEGYGLTETSPVISLNRPNDIRYGTVGQVLPGVEVKLGSDGELLARGPNIMKGYYNLPEATAQAIDADGWFHTGDIAEVDAGGRIKIVDRKKEIIVMSNGKNVAPQPIENAIKASTYIEQVMTIGDQRNFMSALVVPAFDALKAFAAEHRIEYANLDELLKNPQVRALFQKEIDKACEPFAKYERIKKFALLNREFDPAQNELTPTLKVKRRIIAEHFAKEIEGMYVEEAVSA
ncbi:MAG: AMP-dependent synthetase/ligase [Candidatus Sericytochromatia bacterium]